MKIIAKIDFTSNKGEFIKGDELKDFTYEEIVEAVDFAHKLNKKVYVTVNIVLHNNELLLIDENIKKLITEYKNQMIISLQNLIKIQFGEDMTLDEINKI